jgi:hypothetical protein
MEKYADIIDIPYNYIKSDYNDNEFYEPDDFDFDENEDESAEE